MSNNHSAMNADRYLIQIISTLSTSANFPTTIQNLAHLGTGLADWCGIYMFENDQTIRRLAVAPVPEIEALFPLDLHSPAGPAHVRRTGEPQVLTNVENEVAGGGGNSWPRERSNAGLAACVSGREADLDAELGVVQRRLVFSFVGWFLCFARCAEERAGNGGPHS